MKRIVLLTFVLIANFAHGKETMNYKIQIQKMSAQPILVMKGKVKIEEAGKAIGARIEAVSTFLAKLKIQPISAPITRTYSFEKGVLEFETGFAVAKPSQGEGAIVASELPEGNAVTTIHTGDQATSENAYAAIHAWMDTNGKKPAGAPWEVYLSENKMEIFFPIQ